MERRASRSSSIGSGWIMALLLLVNGSFLRPESMAPSVPPLLCQPLTAAQVRLFLLPLSPPPPRHLTLLSFE